MTKASSPQWVWLLNWCHSKSSKLKSTLNEIVEIRTSKRRIKLTNCNYQRVKHQTKLSMWQINWFHCLKLFVFRMNHQKLVTISNWVLQTNCHCRSTNKCIVKWFVMAKPAFSVECNQKQKVFMLQLVFFLLVTVHYTRIHSKFRDQMIHCSLPFLPSAHQLHSQRLSLSNTTTKWKCERQIFCP